MKNVSLSTSKNNYIDPRIIFAFIKKFDIPVEKIFTASLLKRFDDENDSDDESDCDDESDSRLLF